MTTEMPVRQTYEDGMVVRGPDNTLYVIVGGELLQETEMPRQLPRDAAPKDIAQIIGMVPPQLSAEEFQAMPKGVLPRGVIEEDRETEVQSSMPRRYMATHAKLSQEEGRLDATTRTWTTQPWVGYTGGVMVFYVGANEEILGNTDLHQFGVDGFRIPFKQSRREDHWWEDVDPEVAQRVVRLEILQTHAPKSRLWDIIDEAKRVGQTVAEVVAIIGAL